MEQTAKPKRRDALEVLDTSDGAVIQDHDTIHTLNATAYELFVLCDGSRTAGEIIEEMKCRYQGETIARESEHFLDHLVLKELVTLQS